MADMRRTPREKPDYMPCAPKWHFCPKRIVLCFKKVHQAGRPARSPGLRSPFLSLNRVILSLRIQF